MDRATREERIAQIETLPSLVENTLSGLDDPTLDTPFRAGAWTIRQIVHHLADSHVNAFIRIRVALTEDHPTIKPYDQDKWAGLPDSSLPLDSSLQILRGIHLRLGRLLRALPEEAWARTLFHPENGTMTIEDMLATYAEHGRRHVGHIRQALAAKR